MEIINGLHQLKVPIPNNPIGFVLPYLFEVPGGCAIIDPGWDAEESVEALQTQMGDLGLSFGDVKQIIVTHVHPDHYGMAHRVREASGAPIFVHELDMAQLKQRAGRVQTDVDAWFSQQGLPASEGTIMSNIVRRRNWQVDTQPDQTMTDGEELRLGRFGLRVIWTPGHSPGHACFYMEDEELLLSGDHVLPTISPNVSLWPGSDDNPLYDYLHSLERLRGLKTRMVLPAHEYSFDDLNKRLDELLEHHEVRLAQMTDAIRDGCTTAYEVARAILWSIGHFDNFDPPTRRAAVTETVAHLRYLVSEDRLRVWDDNGILRFRIPA